MTNPGLWSVSVSLDLDPRALDEQQVAELLAALAHREATLPDAEDRVVARLSVPASSPIEAVAVAVADVLTAAQVRLGIGATVVAVEASVQPPHRGASADAPESQAATWGRGSRGRPSSRVISVGSATADAPEPDAPESRPAPTEPDGELRPEEIDVDDVAAAAAEEAAPEDEEFEQPDDLAANAPVNADGDLGGVVASGFALEDGQTVLAYVENRWRRATVVRRGQRTVLVGYVSERIPRGPREQRLDVDRVRLPADDDDA